MREIHATLQLPRETVAEKPGEFREACARSVVSWMVTLSEACWRVFK